MLLETKVHFNTPWKRKMDPPEKNGGKKITSSSGFIPHNVRIQQMMEAGERLEEWREHNFDYFGNPDTDEIEGDDGEDLDPTRNMDLLDGLTEATHAKYRVEGSIKDAKKRRRNLSQKADEVKAENKDDQTDRSGDSGSSETGKKEASGAS